MRSARPGRSRRSVPPMLPQCSARRRRERCRAAERHGGLARRGCRDGAGAGERGRLAHRRRFGGLPPVHRDQHDDEYHRKDRPDTADQRQRRTPPSRCRRHRHRCDRAGGGARRGGWRGGWRGGFVRHSGRRGERLGRGRHRGRHARDRGRARLVVRGIELGQRRQERIEVRIGRRHIGGGRGRLGRLGGGWPGHALALGRAGRLGCARREVRALASSRRPFLLLGLAEGVEEGGGGREAPLGVLGERTQQHRVDGLPNRRDVRDWAAPVPLVGGEPSPRAALPPRAPPGTAGGQRVLRRG